VCAPAGSGKSAFAAALVPRPAARILATEAIPTIPDGALPEGAATSPPPIVVVDDVDHLEPASLALLVAAVAQGRLRLVALRRSTRPARDAVSVLWRELGLVRLDLPPLDGDEAHDLLVAALGGPVEGRTAAELVHLANGSPLVLREAIDASLDAGALIRRDGLWLLAEPAVLSPEVDDRAAAELAGLGPEATAIAELLAIGGPLPLAVLERAGSLDGVEELERAGLAQVDDDELHRTSLASPVVSARLHRTVGRVRARRLAGTLADAALEAGLAPPGGPLELAAVAWQVDAGRTLDGPSLFAAARRAVAAGDTALGERLAAASAASDPTTEAVLLRSWCADEQGALDRGRQLLDEHRPIGGEAIVALAIRRAEQAFWHEHDPERAVAILADASAATTEPWSLAIDAQRAVFDLLDGRPAIAHGAASLLVAHPTHVVGSTAALASALALTILDRPGEARAVADEALRRLAEPTPALSIDPGVHVISLGFALHGLGELVAADELTASVYEHALAHPGRQAQGWAALLRSHVLIARGQLRAARTVALEAEQIWQGAGLDGLARWSATVGAQASAELGDLPGTDAFLDRAEGYDPVPFRLFAPEEQRARAWRRSLAGDDGALDELQRAAALANATGRAALAAAAAHDLTRLGDPAAALAVLGEREAAEGLTALRRRQAVAAAAADAAELEAVAADWERIGAAGAAAEAYAQAATARPPRAAALAPKVARLVGDGGLATPPLQRLAAASAERGLTAREQEVVALASAGRSNREIADELVVSLRTVENHLHRAFAKLGVASRAELGSAP
jgi:DNA-binding CsgD family transcriptional regulator